MESLEGFLADDLTYSHTTGWTENKSQFLSTVESGKIDYVRKIAIKLSNAAAISATRSS
jgi:hypothetical protein